MNIDATFWVAISFLIFIGIIFYFKVPQKIDRSLNESIDKIKQDLDNAEKLKDEAKNVLSEYENKLSKSKKEINLLIQKAQNEAEKNIIKTNSTNKINLISEEIASNLVKDIFGEDPNKSSVKAIVNEIMKGHKF